MIRSSIGRITRSLRPNINPIYSSRFLSADTKDQATKEHQQDEPDTSTKSTFVENLFKSLRKPKIKAVDLFSAKEFGDMFEELPNPPEGKEYFLRLMSWEEVNYAASEAESDPKKTEFKNVRYYHPGQTSSVDDLILSFDRGSKKIALLFEIDTKNVVIVSSTAVIGNYTDPENLVYFKHCADDDIKHGITNLDKLHKLTNVMNDCMVSIPEESYFRDSRLLIPSQIRLTESEFINKILDAFEMERSLGNDKPAKFALVHEDKIYSVRPGQEEVVEKVLKEKAAAIEQEKIEDSVISL